MDLLSILPDFPSKPYTHLLPSLERNKLSTVDLITLDTLEIAKRAHLPPADVRRFSGHVIEALHGDAGFETKQPENVQLDASVSFDGPVDVEPGPGTGLDLEDWSVISTLDPGIDELLGGGVPTGYLTEVTGESGSGKTQFLLSLLLSVQLAAPRGLEKRAIYISTEAALSTPRLSQMLKSHPYLSTLPPSCAPSLTNILSINAMDLESQDHILNYQVPVAVQRYNVGLVVVDSITANYRAEHTSTSMAALSTRSSELAKLGHLLRSLAATQNVAIVVANQVSDRFADAPDSAPYPLRAPRESGGAGGGGGGGDAAITTSSPAIQSSPYVDEELAAEGTGNAARSEILSLLHQQRFFTGWGDTRATNPDSDSVGSVHHIPSQKTPALGLVWSTQIACRIALKKERPSDTDAAATKGSERVSGNDSQTPKDEEDANKPRVPDDQGRQNPILEAGAEKLTRRVMKLVMAPWTGGSAQNRDTRDEVEFEIWKSGLSSRLKPEYIRSR
ncbi:hypothetical protein PHISP_06706 [Aspergillus sp. HF37]|nr:hypothetical protein PHISP_06706 [Aspergillus sp. HF37]